MKTAYRLFLQIILSMTLLISCALSPTAPITTVANTEIPTDIVLPTQTLVPTNISVFLPKDADELQSFVISQLNEGKTVSQIHALFNEDYRHIWVQGQTLDLDGDGQDELFLIASAYFQDISNLENMFWIIKKNHEQYTVSYSKSENALYVPKLEFVDDFDNDNLPDLIFTRPAFGDGSGAKIFVVHYTNSKFAIDAVGETDLMIDTLQASTKDKNGFMNLVIVGFEPGWATSGPGRTVNETYSVIPNKYSLLQSHYLPDNYRIHVLQDAQIAYEAHNDELAVKLWEQAAHDQSLENFPSMHMDNDIPEKYQPAFAVYRLYTYYLSIKDDAKAQVYWTELNNDYPKGAPGSEFIPLAIEAKRLLATNKPAGIVCDGIYKFLNSTTQNVNFIMDHWYWGDHNLDIVEFCPVQR